MENEYWKEDERRRSRQKWLLINILISYNCLNRLNLYLEHKILLIFTKKDRLKNNAQKKLLEKYNEFADRKLNKKFFNTSIKEANTIILLKKFLMHSL